MQPGQPVDISVDAYPNLKLRGHLDSIQAGSGAAFSLLPPENATGNYVKVVQRVPVKIVLDEQQQVQRVLGPGMSVVPTVFVGGEAGAAWKVATVAIILVAGVIFGAALWIGRVRRRQS
jgi:membrane fusion protein (multidrug efflux system)